MVRMATGDTEREAYVPEDQDGTAAPRTLAEALREIGRAHV